MNPTRFSTAKFFALLLLLAAFMPSCKKATDGVDGVDGAPGAQGPAGTANVIYSGWIAGSTPKDSTFDGSAYKVATIPAAAVTQDIITRGTVLVYFTYGAGVFPLPYTSNAGSKVSTIGFVPKPGMIVITRFTYDNSASVNLGFGNQYRFIVIPGGVQGNSARRKAVNMETIPDIDYSKMSFEEVLKEFGQVL